MGFMDKVKESVKNADDKLGKAIDNEKLDSEIRKNERKIEDIAKELGEKVIEILRKGEEVSKDLLDEYYAKVKECDEAIENLKADKEALKDKPAE